MDNTQIMARDGSWFLFADWQGITRISLPGDRVKTDANLDRPHDRSPLVLRPNGRVWSRYGVDVDPVAVKKVEPDELGHESPDPLGGPDIAVDAGGERVTIRKVTHLLAASGEALQLGGVAGRRETYAEARYNLYPDGSLVVFGGGKRMQVGLVTRAADGAGRVAWCRPVARVLNGAPDAFRDGDSTWLADRDLTADIGHLVEVRDDGTVVSAAQASAVAGPWVFAGEVWWQPDDATVCAGARLGEPARSFALSAEHAGPGRLLRVPGRALFLPWHRTAIVDLTPAKRDRVEISRKHKAADAPMYFEAERALRPIRAGMARRNIRVGWLGCVRSGKRREPYVEISGRSDLVTYILAFALQDGMAARLASVGVTTVGFKGGENYYDIFAPETPPMTGRDLMDLVTMLDAAGISRAAGIGYLQSLRQTAKQRGVPLPITPEAEQLARASVLSGLRLEHAGAVPSVTSGSFAAVAPILGDHDRMREAGINASQAALFLTVGGHEEFGALAVESTREVLITMNPTYADDVAEALGQPVVAQVSAPEEIPALSAEETRVVAELEGALVRDFAVDPQASREGRGWYRFSIDGVAFQAGLHDDLRVQATLCATDADIDMKALTTSLRAANKGVVGARFEESDCYLHARAACAFGEVSAAKVKAMVEACRDAAASAEGQKLRARYRSEA